MDIPTKAPKSVADFSPCHRYRYTLVRDFAQGTGTLHFIMLNPSTANETFNDPTVGRCENRTLEGGYGRMIVTNIFAFRATDPQDMRLASDPIGERNDEAILKSAHEGAMTICAWGNHGDFLGRGQYVRRLLQEKGYELHFLKMNGSGHPAHPLYLPKALVPQKWVFEET